MECSVCRKWFKVGSNIMPSGNYEYHGQCRAHPPTIVPSVNDEWGIWPRTYEKQWCDEFEFRKMNDE